jgi:hypothetical protein
MQNAHDVALEKFKPVPPAKLSCQSIGRSQITESACNADITPSGGVCSVPLVLSVIIVRLSHHWLTLIDFLTIYSNSFLPSTVTSYNAHSPQSINTMQRVQSKQAVLCDEADPHGLSSSTKSMAASADRHYAQLNSQNVETQHHRSELSLARWCHEVHRAQKSSHWWCNGCCPRPEPRSQPQSQSYASSRSPASSRSSPRS